MIGAHGWRVALFVFAGFAILMGLLAIAIGRDTVANDAEATKGSETSIGEALRNAIAHRGFMAMTIAFFACGFQLMFITTHFAQFLSLCGIGANVSASAIGIIGLSNAGCLFQGARRALQPSGCWHRFTCFALHRLVSGGAHAPLRRCCLRRHGFYGSASPRRAAVRNILVAYFVRCSALPSSVTRSVASWALGSAFRST
jgi:hypothetical protein